MIPTVCTSDRQRGRRRGREKRGKEGEKEGEKGSTSSRIVTILLSDLPLVLVFAFLLDIPADLLCSEFPGMTKKGEHRQRKREKETPAAIRPRRQSRSKSRRACRRILIEIESEVKGKGRGEKKKERGKGLHAAFPLSLPVLCTFMWPGDRKGYHEAQGANLGDRRSGKAVRYCGNERRREKKEGKKESRVDDDRNFVA